MPQSYKFDLVCTDSGPAGHRAAIQAAKLRKRAAVADPRQHVGGTCGATGTIPSRAFREAVLPFAAQDSLFDGHLSHHLKSRPTAEQLLQRVDTILQRKAHVVEDQRWRSDIQLLRGEAALKDPHTLTVVSSKESRTVTADKILMARGNTTGSFSWREHGWSGCPYLPGLKMCCVVFLGSKGRRIQNCFTKAERTHVWPADPVPGQHTPMKRQQPQGVRCETN